MNWSDVKHFQSSEFDSPDEPGSAFKHMNLEFVKRLDELREKCGFPLIVTSGYRTEKHNAEIRDSVQGSAHCLGLAVDIACRTSRQRCILVRNAFEAGFTRIGVAHTFVHIDADETKALDELWLYPLG